MIPSMIPQAGRATSMQSTEPHHEPLVFGPPRILQTSFDPKLRLTRSLQLPFNECHSMALFPWNYHSLESLWSGAMNQPGTRAGWQLMIDRWLGAVVVGGNDALAVVSTMDSSCGFCLQIPTDAPAGHFSAVAWALSNDAPLEPLIVCSRGSLFYVLNAEKKRVIGQLRGHGGEIVAIAVNPSLPYLVCTCSRDFSARLYDLTMSPRERPNNPHWPPSTSPSLGGAPHGLQSSEPEGVGIGRCIAVLSGGPSGGHDAAVLGAAFHPTRPLIATCGMDRAVKIWRLPRMSPDKLVREDKPLFSSTRIHKARILSVSWLSMDVLVTHCAPALMRRNNDRDDLYYEDGTIAIWRWLGFDRFFPEGRKAAQVMRGCASDYQESSSFKVLSLASIPQSTKHLHVSQVYTNDHIIAVTLPDRVCLQSISQFEPRKPPSFPLDQDLVTSMASGLHLDDEGDEDSAPIPLRIARSQPFKGREIVIPGVKDSLKACVLGFYGVLLMVLDSKKQVWILEETAER